MKQFFLGLAILPSWLLAAEGDAAPASSNFWQPVIMIVLALVFFYFILWRPEQKRRKAMEQQRSSMKKGDKVTAMGIIGTVSEVKEKTVVLKMIDAAKIEVLKAAITEVEVSPQEERS